MKKVLLLVVLIVFGLLSACSAEMNDPDRIDDGLSLMMSFDYHNGTFNDAPNQSYISGIHDYAKEFFAFYDEATAQGYINAELSDDQIIAYQSFFDKVEDLNRHDTALFDLDSSGISELLEGQGIDVTALDIFTFNAIKNTFHELNNQTIRIRTQEFLEIFLDRPFTTLEQDGYNRLIDIREEYYYEYYEPLPIMDFEETIDYLGDTGMYAFTDSETEQLQAFFALLETIKNN